MQLKLFLLVEVLLVATTKAQLVCYTCNDCNVETVATVQACGSTTVAPPGTTQPLPDTTTVVPPVTTLPPATTVVPPDDTTTPPPATTIPDTTTSPGLATPETTLFPPITTTLTPTTLLPPTSPTAPPDTTLFPPTTATAPDGPPTLPTTISTTISSSPGTDGPATPTLPTTISTTLAPALDLATPPIWQWFSSDVEEPSSRMLISMPAPTAPLHVCFTLRSNVGDREVVRRGCTQLRNTIPDTCNYESGGQHTHCSVCMTHLCNYGS
ncbi:mucin-2-like [Aedes albopictus]|uniref:Uncharacterized protein n=1 Tax=Aedes albopictus TaxID=7160 RepID=A0ABM1Z2F3_AEDAL|nr:mucin-2-like [Aedes albopictus]